MIDLELTIITKPKATKKWDTTKLCWLWAYHLIFTLKWSAI